MSSRAAMLSRGYRSFDYLDFKATRAGNKGKRPLETQGQSRKHVIAVTVTRNRPNSLVAEEVITEDEVYDPPISPLSSPVAESRASRSRGGSTNQAPQMESADLEENDWRKFEPPKELLDVPFETPLLIKDIVKSSVEKLQEQLVQVQSARENAVIEREPQPGNAGEGAAPKAGEVTQGPGSESQWPTDAAPTTAAADDAKQSLGPPRRKKRDLFLHIAGWGSREKDAHLISSIVKPAMSIIKRPASQDSQSAATLTKECVSCLEEFKKKDAISVACHSYCKPCFQLLISTALGSETYWPPKCCLNEIPVEVLLPHMDRHTRNSYKKVAEERSVAAADRVYCSSCTTWIPPRNIKMAIACAACPSCKKKTCTSCRDEYHPNGECPQDPDMRATLQLASDEGWRRCYSCQAMVEHNQGCIHMTCKCNAQFCYVCGTKWRECSCDESQLEAILEVAAARRREAQELEDEAENRQREATSAATLAAEAEAAELAEILARIERFEMEEAIKLVAEQEQRHLEEVAARQRRQEEAIMVIGKKFHELHNDLNYLHAVQKVAITERMAEELEKLGCDIQVLEKRHAMELKELDADGQLKQREENWNVHKEQGAKKKMEEEIEARYVNELRAYWENKPNGEEEITKASDVLRSSHREGHARWEERVNAKEAEANEAQEKRVSELQAAQQAELELLTAKVAGLRRNLDREKAASEKWLEEVSKMRAHMIAEMEEAEYSAVVDEE